MTEHIDVVIIGAGQAGLSMSYYLTQMERKHFILEQASELTPTWRKRWDSFTLVLPNWTVQMPGYVYSGDEPDGFMDREELVKYMEQFAASFGPEIRFGWKVNSVEGNPDGDGFLLKTSEGDIEADNVVVAAGTFQQPKIPSFSSRFSEEITQIHTNDYRNPKTLPDGAVLVVGTGQSGCQIAEELYQSGRKVFLCVGGATPIPRRYRGKDIIWWLGETGFFDQTVDTLPSSKARFAANPFVSGKDGGHSLNLHKFARDGVTLLGHLNSVQDKRITLAPDLHENLAKGDQFIADVKRSIDKLIKERESEAEEDAGILALKDGFKAEIIEELDLDAEGISTVVWATGYRFDYSWIKFPLLDQDNYPVQKLGVTEIAGLYFVGLNWAYRRKSGLLWGVDEIAANIAEDIASRTS